MGRGRRGQPDPGAGRSASFRGRRRPGDGTGGAARIAALLCTTGARRRQGRASSGRRLSLETGRAPRRSDRRTSVSSTQAAESAPKPAGQLGARDRVEFSDARFDSDLFSENPDAEEPESAQPSTVPQSCRSKARHGRSYPSRDRHARWRTGPMRAVLVLGCSRQGRRLPCRWVTTIATASLPSGRRCDRRLPLVRLAPARSSRRAGSAT